MDNQLMIGRLKKEMERAGINARELSGMANVGRSFVYDILSGKSLNPTTKKIAAIAAALGVSVPYLISGNSNDNKSQEVDFLSIAAMSVEINEEGKHEVVTKKQAGSLFFGQEWIEKFLCTKAENLRVVFIEGDSMEPALFSNDAVIIDVSKTTPNPPGVFLLFDGVGLVAKRLEYISKGGEVSVRVTSDNKKYHSYERNRLDLDIAGKVVWFSRSVS